VGAWVRRADYFQGKYLRLHIRGWKEGTVACSLRTANDERGHHTPKSHTHTHTHLHTADVPDMTKECKHMIAGITI
jgi:hypothetical protein